MALYVGGTSLLLHGNGADGSTVFTDETGNTVKRSGNARISTAQSKFGGSSMYFDGSSFLEFPGYIYQFLASITIEAWVYPVLAGKVMTIVGSSSSSAPYFAIDALGILTLQIGGWYASTTALRSEVWQHVALCKFGSNFKFFINGVESGEFTTATAFGNTGVWIGSNAYGTGTFTGYIDDLRISNGYTPYQHNFTPPTSQLGFLVPIPITIQAHDPGITKLAKYDPSQIKPVMCEVKDDLQDRIPYGLWTTPAVFNEFKGRGRITGTVKNTPGTPVFRQVRLHREPDGMFVRAVWSDPITGAYEFNGVKPDCKYTVTSYDHTQAFRAVIADRVTPDVLP